MGIEAAIIGGSVLSGAIGAKASKDAAKAQSRSVDAGVAEQRRQFNLMREDTAPYRQAGYDALGRISDPDARAENFMASPGYEWRRSEGMRDIGNSFAVGPGSRSGNALKALAQYNQGLAAGEFGAWFDREAALAGIGQTAVNTSTAAGANSANAISNSMMAGGNARASGILGVGSSLNNAVQGGLSNALWARRAGLIGGAPTGGVTWSQPGAHGLQQILTLPGRR